MQKRRLKLDEQQARACHQTRKKFGGPDDLSRLEALGIFVFTIFLLFIYLYCFPSFSVVFLIFSRLFLHCTPAGQTSVDWRTAARTDQRVPV